MLADAPKPGTPPKKLLLIGPPGCGKTTVIRRVIERLPGCRLAGFYSEEIRHQGRRLGFEAVGLSGASAVLAHVDLRGKHRVGRYGVDLSGFEDVMRDEIGKAEDEVDLFVIDEIGKMECLSRLFVVLVGKILDGPVPLLATVAAKGSGLIAQVKARPDVELFSVSAGTRDHLPAELVARLRSP